MSVIEVPKFALGRPPANDDELWWAIYAMFDVKVPRQQICAHHVAPFTALSDAYFARHPVSIWHGSRGYGGKSFTLSVLSVAEAAFLGAQSNLLGGSGAQSLNVHEHCTSLWAAPMAPRGLLAREPTKYDTALSNRGHIRTLMASQTSVRGPHPQRLRLDEIDEMDLDILEAAQGQPMRKRGIETQTVMSSTWQYPDKTMATIMERAGEKGWPIYSWCYRETANKIDGWLDMDEVLRKKKEIPSRMWDAEYELQEPSFEGRAIDQALVEACFLPALGVFTGMESQCRIEEPLAGVKYVTGTDWAKERDRTVVCTFKLPEWTCVAWQAYNKLPWPVQVRRAFRQWSEYGGEWVHDQTGLGNVVHDLIEELTHSRSEMSRVKGLVMSRGVSNAMFSEYITAIEQQNITYPKIGLAYDEHRYVTMDDLYTSKGHAPDTFVAGALAWTRRKKALGTLPKAQGTPQVSGWNLGV